MTEQHHTPTALAEPPGEPQADQAELFDSYQAAAYCGVGRDCWLGIVKGDKGKSLKSVTKIPWHWTRDQLDKWMKSVPTLQEAEASGEWVWIPGRKKGRQKELAAHKEQFESIGVPFQTIWKWKKKGLLKEPEDVKKVLLRTVDANGERALRWLTLVRRQRIAELRADSTHRRSEAVEEGWAKTGMIHEEKQTLLRLRGVRATMKASCGWEPSRSTIHRWSNLREANRKSELKGCIHLDGSPLTILFRDKDDRPTTKTDREFRCWILSEIEEIILKINRLQENPKGNGYDVDETSRLVLVRPERLMRNKVTDPMGLEKFRVPAKRKCQPHRRSKRLPSHTKTTRRSHVLRFVKASVDQFVLDHPHLKALCLLATAAEELNVSTARCRWMCREGLLECREAVEDSLPTKKSVADAKKILAEAGGDFKKLVAKLKEARDKRTAQAALPAPPETVAPINGTATDPLGPASGQVFDLSIREAHELSGISEDTISRAARAGEIANNGKEHKARRLDPDDFARWHRERVAAQRDRQETDAEVQRRLHYEESKAKKAKKAKAGSPP